MLKQLPNRPLEWTGHHQLSAAPPQIPCMPLRGSVTGLADEVEIEAAPGALTIRPSSHPRAGWAEAAAFDPDGLLDQMTSTRLDNEEWSW